MGLGTGSIGAGGAILACGAEGGEVETGGTRAGIIVSQEASATVNAAAMAILTAAGTMLTPRNLYADRLSIRSLSLRLVKHKAALNRFDRVPISSSGKAPG